MFTQVRSTKHSAAVQDVSSNRASRRAMYRFILFFLATAFALLAAYRYSINSTANRYYLYLVARHTSIVLALTGHSATIEDSIVFASKNPRAKSDSTHLTPWQQWDERAQRMQGELRIARARLDCLQPFATVEFRSRAEALAYARSCLDSIRPAFTSIALPPDSTETVAGGFKNVESELTVLGAADIPNPVFLERFAATLIELDAVRKERVELLAARVAALEAQIANAGPRVHFVAAQPSQPADGSKSLEFRFHVVPDCGAFSAMAIFFAAVVSFPTRWRKRLVGVLAGIPLLYAVNIVRLACLAHLGARVHDPMIFEFAHKYVWQAVFLVFIVGIWLIWAEFALKKKRISFPVTAPI